MLLVESTFTPLVVLVIHVNIYVDGIMFSLSTFQEELNLGKHGMWMWTPGNATCVGKGLRLYTFGLVIQDQIDSIGNQYC